MEMLKTWLDKALNDWLWAGGLTRWSPEVTSYLSHSVILWHMWYLYSVINKKKKLSSLIENYSLLHLLKLCLELVSQEKNLGHSACIGSTIAMKEKYKPLYHWCHSGRFCIVTSRSNFVKQVLNKYFMRYEIS